MKIKADTMVNELTQQEIAQVFSMYLNIPVVIFDGSPDEDPVPDYLDSVSYNFDKVGAEHTYFKKEHIKLVLNQVKHMPDDDVYMMCYWYASEPFAGSDKSDWKITRDSDTIKVFQRADGIGYLIDTDTGNIHILRNGQRMQLGTNDYATQFKCENGYATNRFFGKGHWANGKTPFQLGLAVPNRKPLFDAVNALYGDKQLVRDWFNDKKLHKVDLFDIEIFEQELSAVKKQLVRNS